MPRKKVHRITVYLLDTDRKRILLQMCTDGPFISQYLPLSTDMNDRETPVETARKLVSDLTHLDCTFLGHNPALPLVLDEVSVKIFAPMHVQITHIDDSLDYVDYVYLAQASASPEYKEDGLIGWFGPANLKNSPKHVKHIVHYILALLN